MKIEILIATVNGKFMQRGVVPIAPYLVINQWSDKEPTTTADNIHHFQERGLAKSRNHALELSTGDILLISDDDLEYMDDIEAQILQAFETNIDADIITFRIKTPDGKPYKKYRKESFWHKKKTLMSVSSVEIAIRRKSIERSGVKFDERFGLGGEFPTGEEIIFLNDALKSGLKILYIPITIVIHPIESSGKNYDNTTLIEAKGAMFYRIFGLLGYAASLLFAIKKHKESPYSLIEFIGYMNKGITQYRSTKQ